MLFNETHSFSNQSLFVFVCLKGSKVHKRRRDQTYFHQPYQTGDIIGCYLKIDEINPSNSEMRFFKNGNDLGIAYSGATDIPIYLYLEW